MTEKGILKTWQLRALAKHSTDYVAVHIAIASGDFDEALKLIPGLSRDEA